jgi:hypothetical protein
VVLCGHYLLTAAPTGIEHSGNFPGGTSSTKPAIMSPNHLKCAQWPSPRSFDMSQNLNLLGFSPMEPQLMANPDPAFDFESLASRRDLLFLPEQVTRSSLRPNCE